MSSVRSMDDIASASQVVNGSELVSSPAGSLMFDKIINVKFIRKHADKRGKDYFTIRSDYEPLFSRDGSMSFVKCGQKPSIKIKYNQVASTTAILVTITVEALFIDREAVGEDMDMMGKSSDGKEIGNPVVWAVVQLGYFDEFPRFDKIISDSDIDRFYDLDNNLITSNAAVASGKQIQVQILNCFPEGNPPDRVWTFNGVIGTLENGLRWNHGPDSLKPNFGNDSFPQGLSKVEAMFYQWITRRFIRSGVVHRVTRGVVYTNDGAQLDDITISIQNYGMYYDAGSTDTGETTIKTDTDGLLKVQDADKLGVKCFCTERVRSTLLTDLKRIGIGGVEMFTAMVGFSADYSLFDESMQTLPAQLNAIKQHYQWLRWYPLPDGNLFIYHVEQKSSEIFRDPYVIGRQAAGVVRLAGVYDITVSGTRTIRCPFMKVIGPMTTLLFQSRYHITDTAGFYTQPDRAADAFLALLCDIEFSTTGDENMMTIMCVDIPKADAPSVDFNTGIVIPKEALKRSSQGYTSAVTKSHEFIVNAWVTVEVTVGDTGLGWIDLARSIISTAKPDDWGGIMPTIEVALGHLKEWNAATATPPGVWNAGRETSIEGDSPECGLVPTLGYKVPWLYSGDVVRIKYPYKENYKDDFSQGVVKSNG
jgi:hypothetical protein